MGNISRRQGLPAWSSGQPRCEICVDLDDRTSCFAHAAPETSGQGRLRTEDRRSPTLPRPVTIVTGASSGIGRALAEALAAEGRELLLIARGQARLDRVASDIRAAHGIDVHVLAADLTTTDFVARLDTTLAAKDVEVEGLVNSAGIGHAGLLADADPARLRGLIRLNAEVPMLLMRHVLPGMQSRRRGFVINMASLGAYVPGPHQAAYYASKAFLLSVSEAAAAEAATSGVRVMAVAPGPVETGFHAAMGAEGALYRRLLPAISPATVARQTLLGLRLGLRVTVPGFLSLALFPILRFIPHRLVVPVVGWILRPPAAGGR